MLATIRHNTKSEQVAWAKLLTGYETDETEVFDAPFVSHVCSWQRDRGLEPDGVIGPKTWTEIAEKAQTVSTAKNSRSAPVKALQSMLGGIAVDGIFGSKTKAAVAAYQTGVGIVVDGICGFQTWNALITGEVGEAALQPNEQPVNYKQYDSRWGKIVYTSCGNKSQTISNSGCGTTSAAMIIATWWDKSITPKETSAEAVKKGYRTKNSGTDAGYFKYLASRYKARKYVTTSNYATAKACVEDGGLVIVNVGPSVWTKGGHYILLWKVSGSTVYINDPASAASNRAKNTASALKAAAKGYYCFFR